MMKKRVVVTGLGAISPIGRSAESFWSGLHEGKSGIGPITLFDATNFGCRIAAEVHGFNAKEYLDPKLAQRTARFTQFALIATREAFRHAGLAIPTTEPRRTAIFLGNGIGGLEVESDAERKLFEKGPSRVPAMAIPKMINNEAAGNVAMEFGIRGMAHTLVTACASGNDAMGHALDYLRAGKADVVVTGGTESAIVEFGVAGFCSLKALSTHFNDEPEKASRPFDRDRDGFVMGEGAGILLFETLEHARKRGAAILAEVAGWAATCDAYHLTSPDPEGRGAAEAIADALADAEMTADQIDYVNAHGTGTPTNDPVETRAIKKGLGEERARRVAISSIKGHIGHCLGAAAALEAVASVMAIRDSFIPPTLHLDSPDPECDLDYVPNVGRSLPIGATLSLSLGFGGHNSALILKKFVD